MRPHLRRDLTTLGNREEEAVVEGSRTMIIWTLGKDKVHVKYFPR